MQSHRVVTAHNLDPFISSLVSFLVLHASCCCLFCTMYLSNLLGWVITERVFFLIVFNCVFWFTCVIRGILKMLIWSVYTANWLFVQFRHCMNNVFISYGSSHPGNYLASLCWNFEIGYFVDGLNKKISLLNSICMLY